MASSVGDLEYLQVGGRYDMTYGACMYTYARKVLWGFGGFVPSFLWFVWGLLGVGSVCGLGSVFLWFFVKSARRQEEREDMGGKGMSDVLSHVF